MTILHRNKHDPKHGSRVPQTTQARSVYGRSLLARQLPRHQSGPPSCGCKAGMPPSCGGNAPMLENFAVETLDACILIQFFVARNISLPRKRTDEKRWVRCPNKQQEPKHIYKPTTRTRTRRRTHRTADATDTEAGGPGTLEHSAAHVTMHDSCSD